MWFDAQAALANLTGAKDRVSDPAPCATRATMATQIPEIRSRVAHVAHVAHPQPCKSAAPSSTRADGLHPDAATLLDFLRREGPHTYGAAASGLGWGATRAWQAEARLRAAGMAEIGELGRVHPVVGKDAKGP